MYFYNRIMLFLIRDKLNKTTLKIMISRVFHGDDCHNDSVSQNY